MSAALAEFGLLGNENLHSYVGYIGHRRGRLS